MSCWRALHAVILSETFWPSTTSQISLAPEFIQDRCSRCIGPALGMLLTLINLFVKILTYNLSGGKTGAMTIDNDHQFTIAMTALLKKNKLTCQVGVEFDTDEMDGFCVRNCVHVLSNSALSLMLTPFSLLSHLIFFRMVKTSLLMAHR